MPKIAFEITRTGDYPLDVALIQEALDCWICDGDEFTVTEIDPDVLEWAEKRLQDIKDGEKGI